MWRWIKSLFKRKEEHQVSIRYTVSKDNDLNLEIDYIEGEDAATIVYSTIMSIVSEETFDLFLYSLSELSGKKGYSDDTINRVMEGLMDSQEMDPINPADFISQLLSQQQDARMMPSDVFRQKGM